MSNYQAFKAPMPRSERQGAYQQLRCLDREFWFAMRPSRACLAYDQLICQLRLQQGQFPAQGPDTLLAMSIKYKIQEL